MTGSPTDADARLVRAAARRVGVAITVAVSVLVLAVVVAAFAIVFSQIPPGQLFDPGREETYIDLGGVDILLFAVILGVVAVALAGTLALVVTRRAVAPLVEALRRQRRFVADASHELRTPLAVLDARLQVLERSLEPGDPHRAIVAELRDDSRNLIGVVADLLDAVEAAPSDRVEPVDVAATAEAATASMRLLARERDVAVVVGAMDAGLSVAMPETSLQRSLIALLDNAVKHSPPGSTVTLRGHQDRHYVVVEVVDQGPGIQGIAPDRVFDRFARSSEAVDGGGSTRTGFGIGLALVQDTVARYGGDVSVAHTSDAGTTMSMRLPRPKPGRGGHRS